MRRHLRRLLRLLLIVFVLLNAVAALHAWRFTHFDNGGVKPNERGLTFGQKLSMALTGVPNPRPRNTQAPDTAYETVAIASNVRLEAWWIRVRQPKGTVLLFHGYGGSKSGLLDKASVFRGLGYNTLLVDFMGAGGSEGRQCTIGHRESVEVRDAVRWLQGQGEKDLWLFGTSMGAAALLKALAEEPIPVRGALIECPFGTMTQTVKNRFSMQGAPAFPMAHLLLFWGGVMNGFNAFAHNPETYARNVSVPVLLMWGEQDSKVLRSETDALFQNLAGPKRLVTFPEAGHENYLRHYAPEWTAAVESFLEGR
ncbi:alpha/beta hydrolase [Flaviaesturariibacter amylovorans]|uniref:Serine aminopeptidase S33 domain-containing protein n=1 Tax=Flaviaesturariibacter amylovorans TaxID=1084520 RepID=A0ABP8G6P9_9BACT